MISRLQITWYYMWNTYILGSVVSGKYHSTVELEYIDLQTNEKLHLVFLSVADSKTSFVSNIIWNALLETKLWIECYILVLSFRISWNIRRSEELLNMLLKSDFGACEQKGMIYPHGAIRWENWSHPYDTSMIMIGLSSEGLLLVLH